MGKTALDLARECGAEIKMSLLGTMVESITFSTPGRLEHFRRAVLEEASARCKSIERNHSNPAIALGAQQCADAILALKEAPNV